MNSPPVTGELIAECSEVKEWKKRYQTPPFLTRLKELTCS
jgi:hypothetical protein